MAIDTVETLLAVLRRVQLLTPEQVDEVARELCPSFPDPHSLADYLVEIDWLTPFQGELLFSGHWDELARGPYQVLARLGEGGVSEVFKAWDTISGRIVALKVLRQHLIAESDAVRQLQRELKAVTRLAHPNIIKTYDAHQDGAVHYFAMEYVEGVDLQRYVLEHGPVPVAEACEYVRQVAQGLQHAHQIGLVHRDVKPANLFLINPPLPENIAITPGRRPPDPLVKILDWGLARVKLAPGETFNPAGSDLNFEKGLLIGTADYIAPEQARDAVLVDIRSDVYSLGCTFYFLLTGQPPFPGTSLMQKLMHHQETDPPPVHAVRPDVSEEVSALIQRMMAKRPDDRFQVPLLVAAALRRFCPVVGAVSANLIRPVVTAGVHGVPPRPAVSVNQNGKPPVSAPNLSRPGTNGHGTPPLRR